MKRAVTIVTAADLVFLLLLTVSGALSGILSDAVYYLAFLIPFVVAYPALKEKQEIQPIRLVKGKSGALSRLLPLFPLVLGVIFLLAYLTNLVLSLLLPPTQTVLTESLPMQILLHAALPAVLEEGLFRYLPLRLIAPHSEKHAVFLSALYFAVLHMDLFRIPYAFAAGLLFAALDLACGSLLPSLLLHFGNNLLSVFWLAFGNDPTFTTAFCATLAALSVLSLICGILGRKTYTALFRMRPSDLPKDEFSFLPVLLIAVALFMAISVLLL